MSYGFGGTTAELLKKTGRKSDADSGETALAFDSVAFDGAVEEANISLMAASVVEEWAGTDDLDDGETLSDRLANLLVGIADEDADGELSDDDEHIVELAMEAAGDYLEGLGVDADDIDLLLNERDNDAAERIQDFVASEIALDSAEESGANMTPDKLAFDAAYRKQRVVRDGKVKWVRKRIAGKVRMSAAQKLSLKKARRKANSPAARRKRLKSLNLRKKSGL